MPVSNSTDRFNGVVASKAIKVPCIVATSANITLSGNQLIDGVNVVTDDRVLVRAQTNAVENGIYNVNDAAWERAADWDGNRDVTQGTTIVAFDSSNIASTYILSTPDPITIGTTAVTIDLYLSSTAAAINPGTITNAMLRWDGVDTYRETDRIRATANGAEFQLYDVTLTEHMAVTHSGASAIFSMSDGAHGFEFQNDVLVTAADFFVTTGVAQVNQLIAGDPGSEATGILVGGVTYESSAKVSDLGGANLAQFIMHRHSTTIGPVIIGALSNTDDATHALVADGQKTLQLLGSGWDGTSYQLNAGIEFEVDGTAAAGDMPGRIIFSTTPAGTTALVESMILANEGAAAGPVLTLKGGTASGNQDRRIEGIAADDTLIWSVGNVLGEGPLRLVGEQNNSTIEIITKDGFDVEHVSAQFTDDTSTLFYNQGARLRTALDGIEVRGGNVFATADSKIQFQDINGLALCQIGYPSSTIFQIITRHHGGLMQFLGENSGGTPTTTMILDPDQDVRLYYAGSQVVQTVAPADGGVEIWNTASADNNPHRIPSMADHPFQQFGFRFITTTTAANPGQFNFGFDNADASLVTNIYINSFAEGNGQADVGAAVYSRLVSGDTIKVWDQKNANYYIFTVSGTPTDNTSWWTIPVTYESGTSTVPANFDSVMVDFSELDAVGGGGGFAFDTFDYAFDTDTAISDPGAGGVKLNNAAPASATSVTISETDSGSGSTIPALTKLTDGSVVRIEDAADRTIYVRYAVTQTTDNGTWWNLQVTHVDGSGTIPANSAAVKVLLQEAPFVENPVTAGAILFGEPGLGGNPINGWKEITDIRVRGGSGANESGMEFYDNEGQVFDISCNNGETILKAIDPGGAVGNMQLNADNMRFGNEADTQDMFLLRNTVADPDFWFGSDVGAKGGFLKLRMAADATADSANWGQIWVHDTVNRPLMYTGSDGVDHNLIDVGGSAQAISAGWTTASGGSMTVQTGGVFEFDDNVTLDFGTGNDVSLSFDATDFAIAGIGDFNVTGFTDMVINARVVPDAITNPTESVTTTNVITAAESGKTFFLNAAGGFTSTLPAPAAGLKYKFIVATAPTTAYIITTNAGANILEGTFLDIVGELQAISAQDTLNFVANTSLVGDSLEVESDGTNWYCTAFSKADGGITVSVT